MKRVLKFGCVMSSAICVAIHSPAMAQDSLSMPQATAGNTARQDADADIIVTAQKRDERLIETPQAVTAFTEQDLARIGATQLRDFAASVPGLSISTLGAGSTQVNLRGVATNADLSQSVGIYVDEVPTGSASAFLQSAQVTLDVGLFDIDRIEVLKGPQGTLYGSATMGGLIKYVTKRPNSHEFSGQAQAGVSSTNNGGTNYNVAAAVNIPLVSDKFALRASAYQSKDGGYIDNLTLGQKDVNRSDIYGGRLDLLFTPTDALSIRLTAFAQNVRRDGKGNVDYPIARTSRVDALTQERFYAEPLDQNYRLFSGTINYDLGFADLTSVTSYQRGRTTQLTDLSRAYLPLFPTRNYSAVGLVQGLKLDRFTEEVRLASQSGKTIEWVIGGVYTHEKGVNTQDADPRDQSGAPSVNNIVQLTLASKYRDYAVFGNVTVNLTEKFDITGGLRYAHNDQTLTQTAFGVLAATRPARRIKDNVVTYLASARYRFSESATAYLRYATGYRPGGPNAVLNDLDGNPLAPPTFEPDMLKSYELGFKAETRDRTFGIDAAVFYIDWSDIQLSVIRSGVGVRGNANDARIKGFELALTARPTDGFVAKAALAHLDARLAEPSPDFNGVKGDRLFNVAPYSATVSADYSFTAGGIEPSIGATLRYVDKRISTSYGVSSYYLPSYTTVDLRAGADIGGTSLQIFVHNLFDGRGQLNHGYNLTFGTALGRSAIAIQQPRTIGLSATHRF